MRYFSLILRIYRNAGEVLLFYTRTLFTLWKTYRDRIRDIRRKQIFLVAGLVSRA